MKTIYTLFIILFSWSAFAAGQGASGATWKKAHSGSMDYLIYVPLGGKPASLMVSLHGCTQKAEDLAELGNWEETAEERGMIVVLPQVPDGGVILGCWDYYGKDQNENNRDNAPLVALTEALLADGSLNIVKSEVYISGLSSGAAQAALVGCLRPDLFVGVGVNSGPAIGTDISDISAPRIAAEDVMQFCQQLAGAHSADLANQRVSILYDDHDPLVNPEHSALMSAALQKLYETKSENVLDMNSLKGPNLKGHGAVYRDALGRPRVSVIVNEGLGHAWASGKGSGSTQRYVNPNSVNYPAYLADFFSSGSSRRMWPVGD